MITLLHLVTGPVDRREADHPGGHLCSRPQVGKLIPGINSHLVSSEVSAEVGARFPDVAARALAEALGTLTCNRARDRHDALKRRCLD